MNDAGFQARIAQVRQSLKRGDHIRALAVADQLVADVGDHPLLRAMRAEALLGSENGEEALAEARLAVELDPNSDYAHRVLGLAAWRQERRTLAQESLERAVELSGRRPELLAEYAWFMAIERGPRLAEAAARRAIDTDAEMSTAWAALGLAQYKLRHRDEAEVSLRRALELNPKDLYAQGAMIMLLQDRRLDNQVEVLADLVGETPGTEEFVASIRDEAKRRRIARMLVERNAMPEPKAEESPRRWAAWTVALALIVTGICLFFEPGLPLMLMICVVLPLTILWYMRRVFE